MRCDAIAQISGLAIVQLPDSIVPGEEGNVALAWPAFRTRTGGRVRNYGSSAKGERFDMNFGMGASAKGAWSLSTQNQTTGAVGASTAYRAVIAGAHTSYHCP